MNTNRPIGELLAMVEALGGQCSTCVQLREALHDLASAMDNAFISSWQSTAGWSKQLTAARAVLQETAK